MKFVKEIRNKDLYYYLHNYIIILSLGAWLLQVFLIILYIYLIILTNLNGLFHLIYSHYYY